MVGDRHAVAQAALAQCGFKIGHALVAVGRIVARRADGRRGLWPLRLVLPNAEEGDLLPAVNLGGNHTPGGVVDEFETVVHAGSYVVSRLALSCSVLARLQQSHLARALH